MSQTETPARRYQRQYVGANDWQDVTEDEVRDKLDGPYHNVDMAMEYLNQNGFIRTPFSLYRVAPE